VPERHPRPQLGAAAPPRRRLAQREGALDCRHQLSPFVGQKLGTFISSENARDLLVLTELVEAGNVLSPVVDDVVGASEWTRSETAT
jgi:hypothetical protein